MKQALIILTVLIYGCSSRQTPKDNSNPGAKLTGNISKFNLGSTIHCEQKNLSYQFDLSINFKRFTDTIEVHDSCSVAVFIKDKNSQIKLDSIFITSVFYTGDLFFNCDSMTISYSTKYNSNRPVSDNYFGDIIVADLNFDNKDDIAIINDSGGNGGPLYSYFIQKDNNRFVEDKFLTDSVTYFPHKIDKSKHRLITYVHAGACCVGEHIYNLDKTTNKWKQTSHKLLRQ
jgi:hypothetical protein